MKLPPFSVGYRERLAIFDACHKRDKISLIKALRACFRDKNDTYILGLAEAKNAVESVVSSAGLICHENYPNALTDLFGVTRAPDDKNVLFFRAVQALEKDETWKTLGFHSLRAAVETIARNFD
jgi:hypothetical protein